MKILLDACVWGKARERLTQEGHDIVWAGDWPEDPGDLDILKIAHSGIIRLVTKEFISKAPSPSPSPSRGISANLRAKREISRFVIPADAGIQLI